MCMKYISSTFQECLTDCTMYMYMHVLLFNGGGGEEEQACLERFNEYLLKKVVVISVWLYALYL